MRENRHPEYSNELAKVNASRRNRSGNDVICDKSSLI